MYKVIDNTIYITRGDSAVLSCDITKKDGSKYTLQEGDVLEFTIKRNASTKEVVIHKVIEDGVFKLEPSETEGLAYGTYKYDVQLTFADGSVDTIITPSDFVVLEEVTF